MKGIFLFDLIAPVYSLFFNYQVKMYDKILNEYKNEIFKNNKNLKILDLGCGTGALLYSLNKYSFELTGIDPSEKMIKHAEKLLKNKDIKLINGNLLESDMFGEKEFDVIFISFVLHGVESDIRIGLLKKALKTVTQKVIVIDYFKRGGPITDLIEFLEGGDYFNFTKKFKSEIQEINKKNQILRLKKNNALYILNN